MSVGDDHALILRQFKSLVKLQRVSMNVCDFAPGFFDEQDSRGMVPDFFSITGACGESHIDVSISLGNHCILGLAVEPSGLFADAQSFRELLGMAVRTMS